MSMPRNSVSVKGIVVRENRQELGWTQEHLAIKSGYTDRLIRKLESGGPVNIETVKDVVDALNESLTTELTIEQVVVPHSRNELIELTDEWFDGVFNRRDLAKIDTMIAEDIVLTAEGEIRVGRPVVRAR